MRALSVRQPWASLIASGRKTVEMRTWRTDYRGPLLICAAQHRRNLNGPELQLPRGVMVAVVQLVAVVPFDAAKHGSASCVRHPAEQGQLAWILREPVEVVQREVSGRLGLFDVDDRHVVRMTQEGFAP